MDSTTADDLGTLVTWLAQGRGDALRHLGWLELCRALAEQLATDMARAALRDEIEAISGLRAGESPGSLAERSPGVAAALRRLPSFRPLDDIADARARLRELDGIELLARMESKAGASGQVRRSLRELEDLRATLEVAGRGSALAVVELIGVAELCRAAGVVGQLLRAADEERGRLGPEELAGLAALCARLRGSGSDGSDDADGSEDEDAPVLVELPELLALLDRSIDREPEEPRIADAASPELAKARIHARTCKQRLLSKADRMLRSTELGDSLRDRYWTEREGRIVLPVRSDALGSVRGQGAIIHGASGSGQTFFVEPAALIEDNNALREAESRAHEEERKVRRELTRRVAEQAEALASMQRALLELDWMWARELLSARLEGVTPELLDPMGEPGEAEPPGIELRTARHPLMLLDGVDVVPSDLVLERGHALVISGPNAGGKTVALKTLGLCALMAAAGLRLACRGRPRIPLFRHLITDVGDDQSIAANLSTFSAHIHHVRLAVELAARSGPACLVLLDEIAVGTDPDQGAALAEAILLDLVGAGATIVVTTHYDRLKLLATGDPRFHNAAVGFDLQRMRPTFRLTLGVPGSSSAIAVARRLGLREPILQAAEALLDHEGLKVDELLRTLDAERQSLVRTRERLERDKQRFATREAELREREKRALEGVRSRKAKAYAAAAEQLRALERELKEKRKELRQAEPARVDELPTRDQLAGDARAALAQHREAEERERSRERQREQAPAPAKLAVGMKVRVISVGQEGEIVALSGGQSGELPKKVTVQLPMLRTTVKPDDLALIDEPTSAPKLKVKPGKATPILDFGATVERQAAAHFGAEPVPVKAGFDNVCDVRGERYDDAQRKVEDFVAQAIARDQDVILIRHGVGSGALRSAVRELLGRLRSVRTYRAGLSPEGGEGVTVAWIE